MKPIMSLRNLLNIRLILMSITFSIYWLPVIVLVVGGTGYALNTLLNKLGFEGDQKPLFILGIYFVCFGFVMAFIVWPQQEALARQLEELPHNDLTPRTPGSELILTGTLRPSDLILDPDAAINAYVQSAQLVAYEVFAWEVKPESNANRFSGEWQRLRRVAPAFITLEVSSQLIDVAINADLEPRLAGHEQIFSVPQRYDDDLKPVLRVAEYRGSPYTHGSQRVQGLAVGDTISLVGAWQEDGTLQTRVWLLGTREQLLQDSMRRAGDYQLGGFFAVFVGSGLSIFAVYEQRRRKNQAKWAALPNPQR